MVLNKNLVSEINVEGGEKFSYKLFIDPNNKYLFEIDTYETEDVLLAHFFKAVKKDEDINI